MSPDPELLGDEPARLGRRRGRDDPEQRGDVVVHSDHVEHEVLDPEPPWRPPRWLVLATLVAVVVGAFGWTVDQHERAQESRALASCRSDLQDAVGYADLRLMAMADYLDPALSVTKGARHGHLADLMAQPARRVLRDVERADRACRAVSVRPWHFAVLSRQRATTAYSSAFAARLRTIADRGRRYYGDSSDLQRLRRAAAIPLLAGPF